MGRPSLRLLGFLIHLLALPGGPGLLRAADERPDVVIVYTDDQRFDSLSCTGNPYLSTPHLDRLAEEGARFENAFVVMSLCCPGRMTFLTGQSPHRHGVLWNDPPEHCLEGQRLFPELFQAAGYATAFLGKWHLTGTREPVRGFDHWLSFDHQGLYDQRQYNRDGEVWNSGRAFSADVLTDAAIEWTGQQRDRPYLLILSLKNCHSPWEPAERHRGALDEAGVQLPAVPAAPEGAHPIPAWMASSRKEEVLQDPERLRELYQRYLELVLSVDDNVGRLQDALEARGRLDSTVFLMTSDNGMLMGEHESLGKGQVFEPSLRVPLLVRWPAEIPAGLVLDPTALNVDLAPTLLDVCSIPIPSDLDGRSLRPLWRQDPDIAWRTSSLHYSPIQSLQNPVPPQFAVRAWPLKYWTMTGPGGGEALVNLAQDPHEQVDLAGDPASAPEVERLREELLRLLEETQAPDEWSRAVRRAHRRIDRSRDGTPEPSPRR